MLCKCYSLLLPLVWMNMSRPDNVVDGMNGSYVEGVCPVSFLLLYKPDCTLTTGNTNQWKVNTSSPGSPSGSEAMCELFTEDSFGRTEMTKKRVVQLMGELVHLQQKCSEVCFVVWIKNKSVRVSCIKR